MGKGVIYACCGRDHAAMTAFSVKSVLASNPDLPTTVYSVDSAEALKAQLDGAPTRIVDMGARLSGDLRRNAHAASRQLKLLGALDSNHDATLFLDSDTYVVGDLTELFEPLLSGQADMILTNNPEMQYALGDEVRPQATRLTALTARGSFNTGVFAFRRTDPVLKLFALWQRILTARQADAGIPSEWQRYSDQEAFHRTLATDTFGVRFLPLSNTVWNAQDTIWYELRRQELWDRVRIFHSRLVYHVGFKGDQLALLDHPRQFTLEAI